jgi:hypothetical protein
VTQRTALTTPDDFEVWVIHMDDALAEFFDRLPEDVRRDLDYSPRSLDVLERWLLEHYAGPKDLLVPAESRNLDGVARYIGETFRKNIGGHWTIDLDNPKNAYFGVPVLTDPRSPVAPFNLTTASTHRRKGTYLRTVLENTAADSLA